jgi:hypothetical protein
VRAGRLFGDGRGGKGANEGKGDQGLLHGFSPVERFKNKKRICAAQQKQNACQIDLLL